VVIVDGSNRYTHTGSSPVFKITDSEMMNPNPPPDYAVAFVDLLGFKTLVLRAHADAGEAVKLLDIMNLLQNVISDLDAEIDWSVVTGPMVPKSGQFSDSLVLVAPMRVAGKPHYNGLEVIAMRCIQITHVALKHGYLVRGAIDVGPLFLVGANIAGRAYMNAVAAEKSIWQPRIILCPAASEWRNANQSLGSSMIIQYDGQCMVNSLHASYIDYGSTQQSITSLEFLETHYSRYLKTIHEQSHASSIGCAARRKWRWMRKYVEHSMKIQQLTPLK
jgi:hypothetical protein